MFFPCIKRIDPDVAFVLRKVGDYIKETNIYKAVTDYMRELHDSGDLVQMVVDGLTEPVRFVVPGGDKIGSVQFVVDRSGRAVIFDLGNETDCNALRTAMVAQGVAVVDAVCITHVHNDHIAHIDGLDTLFNDERFDFGDCVLYYSEPNWEGWTGNDYEGVHREIDVICNNHNIPVVNLTTENQVIPTNISGLNIYANNCSIEKTAHYAHDDETEDLTHSGKDELNNYSVLYSIVKGNSKIVITGDIMRLAQGYNVDVLNGANLYSVPHHGLNIASNREFVNNSPVNAYVGAYGANWAGVVSRCYPDISGHTIHSNASQGIIYEMTIDAVRLVESGAPLLTDGNAGYYIEPGTDVFALAPGRYFTLNAEHTATLVNAPAYTSAFVMDVICPARSEVHFIAYALYNWHSTIAQCNKSVNVWTYIRGTREYPDAVPE